MPMHLSPLLLYLADTKSAEVKCIIIIMEDCLSAPGFISQKARQWTACYTDADGPE